MNANATGRREQPRRSWRGRLLWALAVLLVARWIDIEFFGHWEVRPDSGDLRRCGRVFASFPDRLRSEDRTAIVAAAQELGIRAEWHPALPSAPSNGDYGNRDHLYTRTACWLREEPGLGKLMLSQLTAYTRHPQEETGWPAALAFLWYVTYDWERHHYVLDEDRLKDNEYLAEQLAAINYTPRTGGRLEKCIR